MKFERYSCFDNYKKKEDAIYDMNAVKKIETLKSDSMKNYSSIPKEVQEPINEKVEYLMSFRMIHNNKFNKYIEDLDMLYSEVANNFNKRFTKGIKNEKDIKLYQKYIS